MQNLAHAQRVCRQELIIRQQRLHFGVGQRLQMLQHLRAQPLLILFVHRRRRAHRAARDHAGGCVAHGRVLGLARVTDVGENAQARVDAASDGDTETVPTQQLFGVAERGVTDRERC